MSVEDGYTQIPNELLFAMGQFGFTQRQYSVLIAVIQKTISWHKETDWICNEQLCELTGIVGEHKVSAVKNELIRMNVLVQQGRKIGVNLAVSEWEKTNLPEKGNLTQKGKTNLPEKGNRVYPKQVTTKETITKEKINNTPLPPTGQSAVADDEQAGELAENSATPTTPKKSRRATKPALDYQAFADLYNHANEQTGSRLPMCEVMNDKRKRALQKLAAEFTARNLDPLSAAEKYFAALFDKLRPFHLGENGGWKASFDWAIRTDTLTKVREGAL